MTTEAKAHTSAAAKAAATEQTTTGNAPIVVDMGKKSRKDVRKLRKGKSGRLMNRVEDTLEHLKENGALAEGVQTVVFIVKQKPKRRGKKVAKMWGLG